jgi:hypothetical protein
MEYLKVPYVRLSGKKYGGDLSRQEQDFIYDYFDIMSDDNDSAIYNINTFQELYKMYKNGEDPANRLSFSFKGEIPNPEKKLAVHDAITAIANKYDYEPPDGENLPIVNLNTFQKISVPNSYFIARSTLRQQSGEDETLLIITDKNSIPSFLILPTNSEITIGVSADKNGNVLIPKEAYDEDLEVL